MADRNQEEIEKVINSVYPLPQAFFELIAGECNIKEIAKKQVITETGDINRSEYFLMEGIIHRYNLVEEGEIITTGFYQGPAILMPNFARTSEGKSIFSLQALTDVTMAELPVSRLDFLQDSYPNIRRWAHKVIEQKLKKNFSNEIRFRSSSAKKRMAHLRKEFPNIENLVPHRCIASYIGVTPVSFSRLRKEQNQSVNS